MQRRSFLSCLLVGGAFVCLPTAVSARDMLLPSPFTPPPPVHPEHHTYWTIEVAITRDGAKVHVYRDGEPFVGYSALAPRVSSVRNGFMVGRVWEVEMPPSWAPTPNMLKQDPTRRAYKPGEPGNPMGQVAKLMIAGFGYQRVHGYSNPRTGNTAGCVALDDEYLRDLVARMGGARQFRDELRRSGTVIFYLP